MPPILDYSEFVPAGVASSALIADPKSWINRRVETIELLTHEETRRRVSVDFTLSDEQQKELLTPEGVVVPISVLSKEPRRNFDIRDEGGRAVPVLGRTHNGALAHVALVAAALDAYPGQGHPSTVAAEMMAADLRQVVFGTADQADQALAVMKASADGGDSWRARMFADERCLALFDSLWANYALFAVLPAEGPRRRVLKYSYGDEFSLATDGHGLRARLGDWTPRRIVARSWRPDRKRFFIECPQAWRAASFHAEIAIPEEVRIDVAGLFDEAHADFAPLGPLDSNVNRASLYGGDVDVASHAVAFAEVVAERSGRVFQAAATSMVVAALLWVGVASELDMENTGPAVTVLLAAAALSSLTGARAEHELVRRVFRSTRRWLGLVAAAAIAAAAMIAYEVPSCHPVQEWRVTAIVGSIAAVRLVWAALRSPSGRGRRSTAHA